LKQIDFPATVHLPSHEFEAGDLTFGHPLDQDEVIAARTAASSLTTPPAKEAMRLARVRTIHGLSPASILRRIIKWNSAMISRGSTRVGTSASIAAKEAFGGCWL